MYTGISYDYVNKNTQNALNRPSSGNKPFSNNLFERNDKTELTEEEAKKILESQNWGRVDLSGSDQVFVDENGFNYFGDTKTLEQMTDDERYQYFLNKQSSTKSPYGGSRKLSAKNINLNRAYSGGTPISLDVEVDKSGITDSEMMKTINNAISSTINMKTSSSITDYQKIAQTMEENIVKLTDAARILATSTNTIGTSTNEIADLQKQLETLRNQGATETQINAVQTQLTAAQEKLNKAQTQIAEAQKTVDSLTFYFQERNDDLKDAKRPMGWITGKL